MKKSLALAALALLGCQTFDPPPSADLLSADNGVMTTTPDEPLVVQLSEAFKTDTLKMEIVQAVIRDENRILPVSSHLEDWLGIKDVTMSVPTLVGGHGAAQPFELDVTDDELTALRRSGETIKRELVNLGF